MALPRSSDLKRRTRKSDCALGESERGGDSPLDQRRSSSPQCADFAHCIGEIAESAKLPRQLFAECAKTAQAHFLFRQMIAKSPLPERASTNRVASGSVSVQGGPRNGTAVAQQQIG